jgi:hypothetical protein
MSVKLRLHITKIYIKFQIQYRYLVPCLAYVLMWHANAQPPLFASWLREGWLVDSRVQRVPARQQLVASRVQRVPTHQQPEVLEEIGYTAAHQPRHVQAVNCLTQQQYM